MIDFTDVEIDKLSNYGGLIKREELSIKLCANLEQGENKKFTKKSDYVTIQIKVLPRW